MNSPNTLSLCWYAKFQIQQGCKGHGNGVDFTLSRDMKVSPSRLPSMWWQLPAWCYTDSDKRKAQIPTHEAKGWGYWNLLPRARDSLLGQVFGPSSPRIWLMHKTLPFIQGWCSILQEVSSVPSPPRKWWHHRPSIPICGVMDSSLKKTPLHQIVIRRKGKTIIYLISTQSQSRFSEPNAEPSLTSSHSKMEQKNMSSFRWITTAQGTLIVDTRNVHKATQTHAIFRPPCLPLICVTWYSTKKTWHFQKPTQSFPYNFATPQFRTSHHRKPETTALVEKNTKEKRTSEKLKNWIPQD